MAYYFNGTTSSDWNNSLNWTPNGIPGTGDDVTFDNNSGPCQVNSTSAFCNNLDFSQGSGYNAQFSITSGNRLDVHGSLTLSQNTAGGLSYSGSGELRVGFGGTSAVLRSYFAITTVPLDVTLTLAGGGATLTLYDAWVVDSLLIGSGADFIIDGGGNTITVLTSFTAGGSGSTYVLKGYGTGSSGITIILGGTTSSAVTWNYTNIEDNATVQIYIPSGTAYIQDVECDGGTITFTSANSVDCIGHTLTVIKGTLDTAGMTWYDVTSDNSSQTVLLKSDLNVGRDFIVGGTSGTVIFNQDTTETVYVTRNLVVGSGGGIKGTASIVLITTTLPNAWTGQWSAAGPGGIVQNNMIVYSCNSRAFISGTQVYYEEGLLTMYA
jgi:hypothetical protein